MTTQISAEVVKEYLLSLQSSICKGLESQEPSVRI